jgi:hypothetical protein
MTLAEFNELELSKQLEKTWEIGVIEEHREDRDHHYILYRVADFFVEIAFHPGTQEVVEVKSFK